MKFKVGDKVACRHPVIVCDDFKDVVGVVVDTRSPPAMDTGKQVITIDYDGCEQGAYVDIDGVEYAEQIENPEVGSKWVALEDRIELADVKKGEGVTIIDNSEGIVRYRTNRSKLTWLANKKDWHNKFKQQKTPDTEASEVTEGYDLSDHFDDQVNSPSHYGQGSIEAIEYIEDFLTKEEYIGYLRGNIAKYLHRWRFKGKPTEDLLKAQWYLNQLIDTVGGD